MFGVHRLAWSSKRRYQTLTKAVQSAALAHTLGHVNEQIGTSPLGFQATHVTSFDSIETNTSANTRARVLVSSRAETFESDPSMSQAKRSGKKEP